MLKVKDMNGVRELLQYNRLSTNSAYAKYVRRKLEMSSIDQLICITVDTRIKELLSFLDSFLYTSPHRIVGFPHLDGMV